MSRYERLQKAAPQDGHHPRRRKARPGTHQQAGSAATRGMPQGGEGEGERRALVWVESWATIGAAIAIALGIAWFRISTAGPLGPGLDQLPAQVAAAAPSHIGGEP